MARRRVGETKILASDSGQPHQRVRALPSYFVTEAAHYLDVPAATIRYWSVGRDGYEPLIRAARTSHPTLLSFLNLTELHVLSAIRRRHQLKMRSIRDAIRYLSEHSRTSDAREHPLISQALKTDGMDLFVERYGQLVNISKGGQVEIREAIDAALKRIDFDTEGMPIKLYPFTRSTIQNAPTMVVIDPTLSAGRPVIAGTGLTTQIIAERYKSGESISDLAYDYERPNEEIEEAIRCELQAAA